MGFGGFGSLGFGRVWVIGWAVGVWGGGRLNGHEKKNRVKKNHGCQNRRKFPIFFSPPKSVKKQGNSLYFFLRNIPVLCEIF